MLIVLEGLDGAGKSTQLRKLTEYMKERGLETDYLHFPRYDSPLYGELISRFLRGDFGTIDSVHPQLVALLFAEDRHAAAPLIRSKLDMGHCVILDRYVYSNIAFQCSKLHSSREAEELREWILNTEYKTFGIPVPDLNLFLDVPISFVDKMLKAEREGDDRDYLEGKSDIHEANIEFQKAVRAFYLKQCELDSNFIRIECSDAHGDMLPADDIFSRIRQQTEILL